MQVRAHGAQRANVLQVVRVIHKGTQKNLVAGAEVLEQMVGPHLVTLVWGKRQPMHQIQKLAHALRQPRLRTMNGPSQLAKPMGMRRQALIISLYLALLGLFCGMASRLYRQKA